MRLYKRIDPLGLCGIREEAHVREEAARLGLLLMPDYCKLVREKTGGG